VDATYFYALYTRKPDAGLEEYLLTHFFKSLKKKRQGFKFRAQRSSDTLRGKG
jgi:hypothetical protein